MRTKHKIKLGVVIVVLLAIPLAVYFDYIFLGYKSPVGYAITCLFEMMIFFAGVSFGEWIEHKYGDNK